MKTLEIPPFYIGQEIIAIKDHSEGAFKKGDEFIVQSIKKGCCKWEVDINKHNPFARSICNICGTSEASHIYWFFASCFAPKLEIKDFISMKQLSEQTFEIVSAN